MILSGLFSYFKQCGQKVHLFLIPHLSLQTESQNFNPVPVTAAPALMAPAAAPTPAAVQMKTHGDPSITGERLVRNRMVQINVEIIDGAIFLKYQ